MMFTIFSELLNIAISCPFHPLCCYEKQNNNWKRERERGRRRTGIRGERGRKTRRRRRRKGEEEKEEKKDTERRPYDGLKVCLSAYEMTGRVAGTNLKPRKGWRIAHLVNWFSVVGGIERSLPRWRDSTVLPGWARRVISAKCWKVNSYWTKRNCWVWWQGGHLGFGPQGVVWWRGNQMTLT